MKPGGLARPSRAAGGHRDGQRCPLPAAGDHRGAHPAGAAPGRDSVPKRAGVQRLQDARGTLGDPRGAARPVSRERRGRAGSVGARWRGAARRQRGGSAQARAGSTQLFMAR